MISKIAKHIKLKQNVKGIPCIIIGVSVNQTIIWMEGFGTSDIENGINCHKDTRMRTASISKSITSVLVAKLVENETLDYDANINVYLKKFPKQKFNGKEYNITLRQLMSHQSGIRDSFYNEYKQKVHDFFSVTQTLETFENDSLVDEPESKFMYSNLGWHVIGAIIESVLNTPFDRVINYFLQHDLLMRSSVAERREKIIPYRSRYYYKNNVTGDLENTIITDELITSVERCWPAYGILSTVGDLLAFGNIMIKSYKNESGAQMINIFTKK